MKYKQFSAIVASNDIDILKERFSKKCLEFICYNSDSKPLYLNPFGEIIGYVTSSKIRNNKVINKFKIIKDKYHFIKQNTPVLYFFIKHATKYKNHVVIYEIGNNFGFYLSVNPTDKECKIISR
ncbi:MAG: hypothetical protein EOL97_15520 [Spirochaetia bacterium]|nr:hypothetical protein [Spirochaetia bacterium]